MDQSPSVGEQQQSDQAAHRDDAAVGRTDEPVERDDATQIQRHVQHVQAVGRVADHRLDQREHEHVTGASDVVVAVDHVCRRNRNALPDIAQPDGAELIELLIAEKTGKRP